MSMVFVTYEIVACVTFWLPRDITLQTHHVYSTLKRGGNDRFHAVSTWNTRVVFVG